MTKKALLIGINYPGQKNELRGCINDVRRMKECLINRYGFLEEDITVLIDTDNKTHTKPTANNIRSALSSLVGSGKPADVLFVQISGHGDRVSAYPKDSNNTGFNEFFVAADGDRITDDELRAFVAMVPSGCRITIVADCCHSGGLIEGAKEQIGDSTDKGLPNSRSESDLECGDFPNGDYSYVNDRSLPSAIQFDVVKKKTGEDASSKVKFGLDKSQHEGYPNSHFESVNEFGGFSYGDCNYVNDKSLPSAIQFDILKEKIGEDARSKVKFGLDISQHEGHDNFLKKGHELVKSNTGPSKSSLLDGGILLSACQSYQKAKEVSFPENSDEVCGVFSNAIQATIKATKGRVTNRELVLKATEILERQGFRQKPGLYCSDNDAEALFLCADLKRTRRVKMFLLGLLIFFFLTFGGPLMWRHMASKWSIQKVDF